MKWTLKKNSHTFLPCHVFEIKKGDKVKLTEKIKRALSTELFRVGQMEF